MPLPKDWNEVPLDELHTQNLVPGDVVTGIRNFGDFSKVESAICRQLKFDQRTMSLSADPVKDESWVAAGRIGDEVRPRGFNGGIRAGYAVIVPFDLAKIYAQTSFYKGRQRFEMDKGRITADTPGLGVIFMGSLSSARADLRDASIVREATYFRRKHPRTSNRAHGLLWRTLGDEIIIGAENIHASTLASISEAYRVAALALRHVISAGLPGQKRRK